MSGRRRALLGAVALLAGALGAGLGWLVSHTDRAVGPPSTPTVASGGGAASGATGSSGATGASGASGATGSVRRPRVSLARRTEEARAGQWSARLLRPALLRRAPGGKRVGRVGLRTGYGAKRVFAVGAVRRGWVGVRSVEVGNNRLAWVPADAVRLQKVRMTLVADLSARELTIRVDGRIRRRSPIGIGRPGSETPIGRYGVTDRLKAAKGAGALYGCCVLPLTGRQPKLPPGWTGGTRLALHGTPGPGSVGREVSAGCLRMRDRDVRPLLTSVPLGATLRVRA